VPVASTLSNLRRLELAIADGLPVLLEGPIGCGKTTLVEYLAQKMSNNSSQLMKLQLGDQMDCKVRILNCSYNLITTILNCISTAP